MKGDGSGTAELQPQQIQCCSYSTYSKNLSVKCNAGGYLLHRDSLFQSNKAQAGGKGLARFHRRETELPNCLKDTG